MTTQPTPIMCKPGGGEARWFFGGLLTLKATAEQTAGELVVAEQLFRRGMATPLHVTPDHHSSWYVLDGRLTFHVAEQSCEHVTAGSFVHVPAGVPHAFRVESESARLLNLTTPQHEQFFRAASVPAPDAILPPADDPRAAVDMDRVGAAAERYGVQIIGPPPAAADPDPLGPPAVPIAH